MPELYFNKLVESGSENKLYFVSYLRESFVERSLVISIDEHDVIQKIYFSSYEFGSTEWINGYGLQESRIWENEDQAQSPTYLTRRYTSRLSDGIVSDDYAEKHILPDILSNMADDGFSALISRVIAKRKYSKKIDLNCFVFKEKNNIKDD